MSKTTKEIVNKYDFEYAYCDLNSQSFKDFENMLWFSQSEVEQLRKELNKRFGNSYIKKEIDSVFAKFFQSSPDEVVDVYSTFSKSGQDTNLKETIFKHGVLNKLKKG